MNNSDINNSDINNSDINNSDINNSDIDICIKIDKLENLFTETNKTPINLIKTTLNKFVNNIIEKFEKNELDEDIYIGGIENNNIKGYGLLIKNNIMIEGKFNSLDNIINSQVNYNDICLKGIIKNGEFYSGTVYNDNIQIIGTFKNGLPDNTIKYSNNSISYEGECRNGLLDGLGLYKDKNISYEGEWKNNKFEGPGILTTKDYVYDGLFENGKKNGSGKLQINNIEYFVEYENDIEINRLDYNEKKIEDLTEKIDLLEINDKNNLCIIKQQEDQIIEYNNKMRTIENHKKHLEDQMNCKICFRKQSNIVLQPCNHYVLCEECELSMRTSAHGKKCPMCRKPYNRYLKIFIS